MHPGWTIEALSRGAATVRLKEAKKLARAVGKAPGRHPVPNIIPGHRVARRDGVIGGFALGAG